MDMHIWQEDKHIQVNEYCAGTEDFRAFWRDLQDRYPGFTLDFCYHNTPAPMGLMEAINAHVLEDCVEVRLTAQGFTPVDGHGLTHITPPTFATFAALHDRANPPSSGMFWTSERIGRDLAPWVIYLHGDSYILMHLSREMGDIYALEAADTAGGLALISAAAAHAFKEGRAHVLRMADRDATAELAMLGAVGFVPCGYYTAYRAVIRPV